LQLTNSLRNPFNTFMRPMLNAVAGELLSGASWGVMLGAYLGAGGRLSGAYATITSGSLRSRGQEAPDVEVVDVGFEEGTRDDMARQEAWLVTASAPRARGKEETSSKPAR
jgi:hypothetical protein